MFQKQINHTRREHHHDHISQFQQHRHNLQKHIILGLINPKPPAGDLVIHDQFPHNIRPKYRRHLENNHNITRDLLKTLNI